MENKTMRDAFEAWGKQRGLRLVESKADGVFKYDTAVSNAAYEAWQAASTRTPVVDDAAIDAAMAVAAVSVAPTTEAAKALCRAVQLKHGRQR